MFKHKNIFRVFVYGTLKVGGRLAGSFDSLRLSVKKGTIKGSMFGVGNSFPAIRLNGDGIIHGEVHEYRDARSVMAHMDIVEGYSGTTEKRNLYNRVIVEVKTDENTVICSTYEFNGVTNKYNKINSGIWEI